VTTFAPIFAPAEVRAAVDDRAWLAAMLDAERSLAVAGAAVGVVPVDAAEAIAGACDTGLYDLDAILDEGRAVGNPVEPLVRALRGRVGAPAADWVHRGATSQDILDTAAMLVTARASALVLAEADGAAEAAAGLARQHRSTVMAARTLLQQAVPTTFGLVAAGWLVGLLDAGDWLRRVRRETLAAELGGAAGTLSVFGADGPQVAARFAAELGLVEATLPWHANRVRLAEVGASLAALAGACGKIGRDVTLLAQSEVGEVAEASGGGSSAMPHKRNPVGSVLAVACARSAAAAADTLTGALVQEHQRAAGDWHPEWGALSDALLYAGGAAAAIRGVLRDLDVDAARMTSNLALGGGVALSEHAVTLLAESLGWAEAQALVRQLAGCVEADGTTLADALRGDARVREALGDDGLARALDPSAATGAAGALVDRALARHAATTGGAR
jgi:3-carboxy-cis,cis-muconate cycloisomerase